MKINEKFYRELRCNNCRALWGYEYIFAGRIAWTCHKCAELNEFNFKHTKTKENTDIIKQEFEINQTKGGEE